MTLSLPHTGLYSAVDTHGQSVVACAVLVIGSLLFSEISFGQFCGKAKAAKQTKDTTCTTKVKRNNELLIKINKRKI